MKRPLQQLLFWTPRGLGILFAAFVSLFALDVFGTGYGFWGAMLALVIHLIPTMIVLIALAIAWRWEAVGGILFIALGGWYLLTTANHLDWCLLISGPLFLTGGLFMTDWLYRVRLRRITWSNGGHRTKQQADASAPS